MLPKKSMRIEESLSEEQLITRSFSNYENSKLWVSKKFDIPKDRLLTVGQEVVYGNHKGSVVLAVHNEGQAITIKFTRTARDESREEIDTIHWMSLFPKKLIEKTELFNVPSYRRVIASNSSIGSLARSVWEQGMNDHPDYQRGYVWTPEDEYRFLESVFSGRNLGAFVILNKKYPEPYEVFDGKQRLNAFNKLTSGQISYKGYFWHQMSGLDRYQAEDRSVLITILEGDQFSHTELLQMFMELNYSGVPQTQDHLSHVRELLEKELEKGEISPSQERER